jgi:hypothetical protein
MDLRPDIANIRAEHASRPENEFTRRIIFVITSAYCNLSTQRYIQEE